MKSIFIAGALLLTAAPAFAGDVSVSIGINQPGFYGQITLGDYPRPAVIYGEPVIIERGPGYMQAEPMYLHVPPGHEKHWHQHCAEYHACGRRVYFVQDQWYRNEYARREHGHGGHDEGKHDDRHEHHEHDKGHHDGDRREGDRDH